MLYQQNGFQSINIVRPLDENQRYITIIRFKNLEYAKLWLESNLRHSILNQIKPCLLHGDQHQIYHDNEFWFNPTPSKNKPKRWKQFILSWMV